jgi:hypothetical protein
MKQKPRRGKSLLLNICINIKLAVERGGAGRSCTPHPSPPPYFYIFFSQLMLSRVRFFFSEPSAEGGYNWLPAPLGCKLANAGKTKTVKNNRDWAELLLLDVYYHWQSRIHRSTITTVARPQLTGSEEPVTRAK